MVPSFEGESTFATFLFIMPPLSGNNRHLKVTYIVPVLYILLSRRGKARVELMAFETMKFDQMFLVNTLQRAIEGELRVDPNRQSAGRETVLYFKLLLNWFTSDD
jgi:hypothetical protein